MVRIVNWLLVTVLLFGSDAMVAKETARIATGAWPPYLSQEQPHYGIAAHIVADAFAAVGVQSEFGFYPWNRVAHYVENGQWDTSILWVQTAERDKHYLFSDVVLDGEAVFFHRSDTPFDWETLSDLQGKRFGGLLSASYPWFEEATKNGIAIEMERVPNESQNIAKLISGRIQAFSLDKLVGQHLLQQNFPEQKNLVSYHTRAIESWHYRLIFTKSPRGEWLRDTFNRGLAILQRDNGIDRYLKAAADGAYLPPKHKKNP